MIWLDVVYRSRGMAWPLRPGDSVQLQDGMEMLIEVPAELVIEPGAADTVCMCPRLR